MEFSVGSHHLTRGMWGPEFGLETPVRASYGQGEAVCAVRAGGFLEPNHITLSKSDNFSVPWFPHTHKSLSIQWGHWEDTIHIVETLWTVSGTQQACQEGSVPRSASVCPLPRHVPCLRTMTHGRQA